PLMKPIVLCLSGLDPCGGAGIQADIEAINAMGAHAASIITCLTLQDTQNVYELNPVNPQLIRKQARTIFSDMPVQAIKIGLIGSAEVAHAIADILQQHPEIPVILDPILTAGGGNPLASEALIDIFKSAIIPCCRLITPNIPEARRLTHNASDLLHALPRLGAEASLITGSHDDTHDVKHVLIMSHQIHEWSYPRLPHEYHGSGCTLAASIAALMAKNLDTQSAVKQALDYTYRTLKNAQPLGQGQWIPLRLETKPS
ncbi:MAG: bifunctional hydroxymethylpyrimidine kinase/phosphomethylpyrimidine kinase, partial [Gammaproteobacteria bacterium]